MINTRNISKAFCFLIQKVKSKIKHLAFYYLKKEERLMENIKKKMQEKQLKKKEQNTLNKYKRIK